MFDEVHPPGERLTPGGLKETVGQIPLKQGCTIESRDTLPCNPSRLGIVMMVELDLPPVWTVRDVKLVIVLKSGAATKMGR